MLAPTGWIGDAAKGVSELSGLGLASRAGEGVAGALGGGALASAAGRAVEGGIYGVGAHIADSSVTGDPLTIEGAIESAGIGAILNVGAGALMDHVAGGIENAEWGARRTIAESKLLSADADTANAGKQLFDDPPPSWNDFREAHDANVKDTGAYNRGVARTADAYDDFVGSNAKLTDAISRAQDLVNKIRTKYYTPAAEDVPVQRVLEKQSDGTWRNRIKIKGDTKKRRERAELRRHVEGQDERLRPARSPRH